ncbi:MAG: hypothetical protein NC392_12935 [Roseburia sp.]|nr:hypothetical protein [Roseburia sp.]
MAIVNITAFFICLLMLSYHWKTTLVEMFPPLTCMLTLVLYVLAFLGHLSLIDGIGLFIIAAFLCWLVSRKQEQRTAFGRACLHNVTSVSFITAVCLLLVVIFCTSAKVVSWWDDVNFWAADVKSIYYLDGFASKYGNVSPEYGDYPPAAQLFKWWFLHFDPHTFREGLAFAGYYVMNIIFMLPLLKKITGKNVFILFGMAAALWFLPSIAEVYGYDGFCADLTMACVYGAFLLAVTDKESEGELFYYGRLALYLSVLVLIKSVGFIWAFFGLVFFFLYQWTEQEKKSKKKVLPVVLAPVITGGSWMLFCLLMRRITRTTATAVKYVTTDEYGLSGYMSEFAKAFIKAFFTYPLHKEKSLLLDLTPFAFYLCICLLVIFFFRRKLLSGKQGKAVLWFSIISGALFYAIIFIAHITIFATETQYLEPEGMISSIERYGAPFTIGTLLFLAGIWMMHGETLFIRAKRPFLVKYGTCLTFILFVALTAGWKIGGHGLIGYRAETADKRLEREAMIDADAEVFLQTLRLLGTEESTRVCYIQRDDEPRWVKNSYTSLEASPVSVVYKSVNLEDAVPDWMAQEIRSLHAEYLYVEDTDADAGAVFDVMLAEGAFACETLYRVEDDGEKMRLTAVTKASEVPEEVRK